MRILRVMVGILLLPFGVAITKTVLAMMATLGTVSGLTHSLPVLAVGSGVILWAVIFYVLPRPVRTYVLAHELTHALWGLVFGARVSGLRVAKSGGSVNVSDVNWCVALAPYFFPLYTFLVLVAYYLLALFMDLRRWELLWFGLIGLTLGFHWAFTLESLAQSQSDIRRYGHLFSYSLIYTLNLLGIGLMLVLVSPVPLELFFRQLIRDVVGTWAWCGLALTFLAQWMRRWWLG